MRRVVVRGCRMTGLLWNEGALRHVVFRDCRIDLAAFAATELEQVIFDGCILRQADFQDADLVCVRFDGCDLTGADLTGAGGRVGLRASPPDPCGDPGLPRAAGCGGEHRRGGGALPGPARPPSSPS